MVELGSSVSPSVNRRKARCQAMSKLKMRNSLQGTIAAPLFGTPEVSGRSQLGRNVLPAPGHASVDLSIQKRFPLTEGHRIEVRADVFNVTNRVNFAPPM